MNKLPTRLNCHAFKNRFIEIFTYHTIHPFKCTIWLFSTYSQDCGANSQNCPAPFTVYAKDPTHWHRRQSQQDGAQHCSWRLHWQTQIFQNSKFLLESLNFLECSNFNHWQQTSSVIFLKVTFSFYFVRRCSLKTQSGITLLVVPSINGIPWKKSYAVNLVFAMRNMPMPENRLIR